MSRFRILLENHDSGDLRKTMEEEEERPQEDRRVEEEPKLDEDGDLDLTDR